MSPSAGRSRYPGYHHQISGLPPFNRIAGCAHGQLARRPDAGMFAFRAMRDQAAVSPAPERTRGRPPAAGERNGLLAHVARRPRSRPTLRLRESRRLPVALSRQEAAELLASFPDSKRGDPDATARGGQGILTPRERGIPPGYTGRCAAVRVAVVRESAAGTALGPDDVHGFAPVLTSFARRARAVGDVAGLLGEHRLVTVTGAAGAGKTRLAGDVARQTAARFADGAWLMELAAVRDPALVGGMVATALGVRDLPGVPAVESLVLRAPCSPGIARSAR